jgi:TonB family protein
MAFERTMAVALAAALSLMAHAAARAADAPPPPPETRRIVATPNETPYPAAARLLNLPGKATLNCTAAADGALRGCKVAGEDPPDWGFGEAAMALAPAINIGPGAADRPAQVPIGFHLEPEEVAADPALKTPGFFIPDKQIKWVERPAVMDFLLSYPAGAVNRKVEGFVALACRVTAEGRLDPCAVIAENPAGEGFDKAALTVATKFRMAPRTVDGRPVENGVMRQGFSWSLQ